MSEVFGRFEWPGMLGAFSGIYTCSHGISPGIASIHCNPQDAPFAETGDLIITDDNSVIRIPDCKVDKIREEHDEQGRYWVVDIFDWRWKWKDLGSISGEYNQLDKHGKLIPWTIRSPEELAVLCLNAMGVRKYEINLPTGLTRAQGKMHRELNPPHIGVIPTRGTNPAVSWLNIPPAQALDELVRRYGRVIVPRLSDYTICIVLPGFGAGLPDGSIYKHSPALDSPETPLGVAVIGDPTRYQARFVMEPVGLDWDGSYRPLDKVSYAPFRPAAVDIWVASIVTLSTLSAGDTFTVNIYAGAKALTVQYTAIAGDTPGTVAAALAALINAAAEFAELLTAASSGTNPANLTITGTNTNFQFTVTVDGTLAAPTLSAIAVNNSQPGSDGKASWKHVSIRGQNAFHNLGDLTRSAANFGVVTSRLTLQQARELALKSVFRSYRLVNLDASFEGAINIPGYGRLERRQQVLLQSTKVDQVTPEPDDANLTDRDGFPYIRNFYNGYSRDMAPVAYGSHYWLENHVIWRSNLGTRTNSLPNEQILIPFTVDPEEQVITFDQPVYNVVNGSVAPGYAGDVVLETGCLIRNAETNELERFKAVRLNPGAKGLTNLAVRHYPDVQLNVIGEYKIAIVGNPAGEMIWAEHTLDNTRELEADPRIRANHYLDGLQAQYFLNAAEIKGYNGFMAINLDGAIQQTTWTFGFNGCETIASRNTEHSVWIEPSPARRRAEFLTPAMSSNIREGAIPSRVGERMYLGNTQARP